MTAATLTIDVAQAGQRRWCCRQNQQAVAGRSSSDDAKIAGMTPAVLSFSGRVRRVALEHAVADLALRILDQQTALGALDEDDERDDGNDHDDDRQDQRGRKRTGAAEFERAGKRRRQTGGDAGEDDQRDAVADAPRCDLLAEPHQEHRAAEQRDDGGNTEEPARIDHEAVAALKADRNAIGLQ